MSCQSSKKQAQCEGCAFAPGAQANLEPYNNLKALICALGFIPFYCHHTRDGRDITEREKVIPRAEMMQAGLVICGGWAEKIKRLRARGHYAGRIKTLQYLAHYAITQLDAMLDYKTNDEDGRAEARQNLWTALELLRARRKSQDAQDAPDEVITSEIEAHFRSMECVARASADGRWSIAGHAGQEQSPEKGRSHRETSQAAH